MHQSRTATGAALLYQVWGLLSFDLVLQWFKKIRPSDEEERDLGNEDMFRMWKEAWKEIDRIWIREDGATVVETAIIVPMIWIMIMGSILLFFFFFDMGVIRS